LIAPWWRAPTLEVTMAAPKAPVGLGKAGKAQWSSISGSYKLRPDELTNLEGACWAADMIVMLRLAWIEAGCPTETKGSMGQKIIHPLIGEMRAQQAAMAVLLRQLKLPDGDEVPATNQHRSAAVTKWQQRGA
jgi:hypothetical protein